MTSHHNGADRAAHRTNAGAIPAKRGAAARFGRITEPRKRPNTPRWRGCGQ